MTVILLTALEREFLLHRLEVFDAIADALEEQFDRLLTEEVAINLEREARLNHRVTITNEVERAVLIDAIEGSTFLGATFEATEAQPGAVQRYGILSRAANGLAKKVAAQLGIEVQLPPGC
jgi:hypothetical protein